MCAPSDRWQLTELRIKIVCRILTLLLKHAAFADNVKMVDRKPQGCRDDNEKTGR